MNFEEFSDQCQYRQNAEIEFYCTKEQSTCKEEWCPLYHLNKILVDYKNSFRNSACIVCGKNTNYIFNIDFNLKSICDSCAKQIASQFINWMLKQKRIFEIEK